MRRRPWSTLIIIVAAFSGWFVVNTWYRHLNFFSSSFDLGNMVQVLWQTLNGNFFATTSPTEGILQSRAAIHADWLLLLYTPFYALWHDPRVLTTLQVVIVASGAFPLFWLARRQLSEWWSVAIAGLFLMQPTLQWSVLFDIHAVVLATPFILWGVWAAVTRRPILMWVFFVACWLAKEEVGIVVALTAVLLGYRNIISRRTAWALGVLSFGWVLLMTSVVIPAYAENKSHFAIGYFSEYGQTVPHILVGLVRHPVILWHDLVNIISLGYLTILLGSAAFLSIRRPLWLVPAVPIVIMNLISNDPHMRSIFYQYPATITPFIMLATIDGLAELQRRFSSKQLVLWSAAWVGVMVWIWAPLPGLRYHRNAVEFFHTNPYRNIVTRLAVEIPPTTPLVVTNDLGPHFSARQRVWVFPFALERAGAIVVLLNRPHDVRPQAELRSAVDALLVDQQWQLINQWNNELYYFSRKKIAKVSPFLTTQQKTSINMGTK